LSTSDPSPRVVATGDRLSLTVRPCALVCR
jgi:hypothetical protein